MKGVFENVGVLPETPDLAGFLMTWCNASDPDVYEQALDFWSDATCVFSPPHVQRRVKPGRPPSYPRR